MKDLHTSIVDMLENLRRIHLYSAAGEGLFRSDLKTQDAIIKNFMVLGEAVKRLTQEFRDEHPEVPWSQIAGFRDVLIHQYDATELDVIWYNVQIRVPALRLQLEAILASLPADHR